MKITVKALLILSVLLFCFQASATHNRSGEIFYKRISPYTLNGSAVFNYSITVIKYFDDDVGNQVADRCADTIYFGDGTKGMALRVNGITSGCSCSPVNNMTVGCGEIINNTVNYRVKKCVYTLTHIYSGAGVYTVYSKDVNRNSGIHNIPNSGQEAFYIEAQIVVNSLSGINTSPVFNNPAVGQATLGACYVQDQMITDADGDSISCSLVPCMGNNGPIPGYFLPETGVNGSCSVSLNGIFTWCVPQFFDEYNVAILVKEYRKNSSGVYVQIGYTMRDLQIIVSSATTGLQEKNITTETVIYPNPFSETLRISSGGGASTCTEAILWSMDGKQVLKREFNGQNTLLEIPTGELAPGVYSLEIKTLTGRLYRKVVRD